MKKVILNLVVTILGVLSISFSAGAKTLTATCFTDKSAERLSTKIQLSRGWMQTDLSVEGTFLIEGKTKVPFIADLTVESGSPMTIAGDFQVVNPYLNTLETISQTSDIYTEISILQNRIRKEGESFGIKPGDTYGFGIHCGLAVDGQ